MAGVANDVCHLFATSVLPHKLHQRLTPLRYTCRYVRYR